MVGAMVIGALVMRAGGDTVTVLRATRDLPAGAAPADLDRVQVERGLVGEAYLGMDLPADAVLRWPVYAGELVPRGALGAPVAREVRQVTVPVEPLHAPAVLNAGDRVDVWATAGNSAGDRAAPQLVLAAAVVRTVAADPGVGGELGVVIDVPVESVADVVAATRGGVVDLVAIPVDAGRIDDRAASVAASGIGASGIGADS